MTEATTFTLGEDITHGELLERFVTVQDEPFGNPDLGYALVLPSDWIALELDAKDAELHVDEPKLLANFLGPLDRGANPMVQVWGQKLVREISALDWLKYYLGRTEGEIVSMQMVSPYFADAIATWQIDEASFTLRTVARVAGDRLFLVQCMAPRDLYPDYAETFGLAVRSFEVRRESDNPHVEAWSTHTLDDAIVCEAPFSWARLIPEAPQGIDAVDLFNLGADGQALGVLKVLTVRRSLTAGNAGLDLPSLLVAEFFKMGVEVVETASEEPLNTGEPFQDGQLTIFTAQLPAGDDRSYCVLLAGCASPTHHILVGLFTCAPEEGFYEYAVNRRAFNIVLETLRVSEA